MDAQRLESDTRYRRVRLPNDVRVDVPARLGTHRNNTRLTSKSALQPLTASLEALRTRLRTLRPLLGIALLCALTSAGAGAAPGMLSKPAPRPLSLNAENPRYFQFRGRPTVLITSGEHYGAVVNPDFDFIPYLDVLQRHRFNLTRLFSGSQIEHVNWIPGLKYNNPVAPRPGRAVLPWAQVPTKAGPRFDLTRWNPRYFERLRTFVREAGRRGIVVEVVLFSVYYTELNWRLSPLHPSNNVNRTPWVRYTNAYHAPAQRLVPFQTALARKLVRELNDFDNVYFEIINEPYLACQPDQCVPIDDWQRQILTALVDEQARVGSRHLIAQNVPMGRVKAPDSRLTVYNFHYATPNEVRQNLDLKRALVNDETGYLGPFPVNYRREAWRFMLSGGSGVSNLDWSFGPDNERGTIPQRRFTIGGGGSVLRTQLAVLKQFFERFQLTRLQPADVVAATEPTSVRTFALSDGRVYGIYVDGGTGARLTLRLPPGSYSASWLNPTTGRIVSNGRLSHDGAELVLTSPRYETDIALALTREATPQ